MPYITQARKDALSRPLEETPLQTWRRQQNSPQQLAPRFDPSNPSNPLSAGDLTYLFSCALRDLNVVDARISLTRDIDRYLDCHMPLKYQVCAEVLGSLTAAQYEHVRRMPWKQAGGATTSSFCDAVVYPVTQWFYNTVVAPYEDGAIVRNGDIYA